MSDYFDEVYPRKLKRAGSKAIEEAITKAISELAGQEYSVSVDSIDFEPREGSWQYDLARFTVSASRATKYESEIDEN